MDTLERTPFRWKPPLKRVNSIQDCQKTKRDNPNNNNGSRQLWKQFKRRQSVRPPQQAIFRRLESFRTSRKPVIVPPMNTSSMQVVNLPLKTRIMRSFYPAFLHLKMKVINTLHLRSVRGAFTTYQQPVVEIKST